MVFECGGNNPAVVMPDADMNLTSREIVKGGFAYAGQRCTAIKYVLGTSGVLESLLQEGPLANAAACEDGGIPGVRKPSSWVR